MSAPETSSQPRYCSKCLLDLPKGASDCPKCSKAPSRFWLRLRLSILLLIVCGISFIFWTEIYPLKSAPAQHSRPALADLQPVKPSVSKATEAPPLHWQFKDPLKNDFQVLPARQKRAEDYPFQVLERKLNPKSKQFNFYKVGMEGEECLSRQDARRYFLSENQGNYPTPESGCGPTALLNLYIWYTKFGLIKENVRHADPEQYKQLKFLEIDRKIAELQGQSRDEVGTNDLEQVYVMDQLVHRNSPSGARIHSSKLKPPLKISDFTNISRNYRAGILSVRPQDPKTGKLMGQHAVLVIRGDRAGKITLANWGQFYHGSLVKRPDGQWFIPNDSNQFSLKIQQLTTLIPFIPKESDSL